MDASISKRSSETAPRDDNILLHQIVYMRSRVPCIYIFIYTTHVDKDSGRGGAGELTSLNWTHLEQNSAFFINPICNVSLNHVGQRLIKTPNQSIRIMANVYKLYGDIEWNLMYIVQCSFEGYKNDNNYSFKKSAITEKRVCFSLI